MGWKENLRPASFRGVAFFVNASQFTTGRRVVSHEFPNRDTPYPEDLGKVGGVWRVEGHILGDDYFATKKSLREAVEKFGSGELIHPYYGTLFVQCGACSFDEDTSEGGYAKVSFQFYEGGDDRYPRAVGEKLVDLDNKNLKALNASKSAFDSIYSVAKAPAFVADTARKAVGKVADLYTDASKGPVAIAEGAADLAYSIRNLKAEVNDLITAPDRLSQRLLDSFALLESALSLPEGKLQAYAKFFSFQGGVLPLIATTVNRKREKSNSDEFDNFVRRVSVANAVVQAAQVSYASSDEALRARDQLDAQIEDIILNSEDDEVFAAFEDLKAALAELLPDTDANLPSIETFELQYTLPSLLVVYDLFEREDAEGDLIARNGIQNPAFIPGGSVLEVLNVRKGA